MTNRKRKSRKEMTPEELLRLREAEAARQRRRRAPKQAERQKHVTTPFAATQAKVNRPVATLTPEQEEFIDVLLALRLGEASYALALWERENKLRVKLEAPELKPFMNGEEAAEYHARKKRHDKFALISYFAVDALSRHKGRDRLHRFRRDEAEQAEAQGIDLETFQKRKRAANQKAKKFKDDAAALASIRQRAFF